jgi:hypothetical protein
MIIITVSFGRQIKKPPNEIPASGKDFSPEIPLKYRAKALSEIDP